MLGQSSPDAVCTLAISVCRSVGGSTARYARPTAVRHRSIRPPTSSRDTSTAERGRIASMTTISSRSRTARCTLRPVSSASSMRKGRARARMSKLRRKPLQSSSTDAVSTKRSLSGRRKSRPAPTSVAVMRDTVGLGMPVHSVNSRLLTGASAAAIRRNTSSPRASAVTSSPSFSLPFSRPAGRFSLLFIVFFKTSFRFSVSTLDRTRTLHSTLQCMQALGKKV